MCKKLIQNSSPFVTKCQKTARGDFFDSHYILKLSDAALYLICLVSELRQQVTRLLM